MNFNVLNPFVNTLPLSNAVNLTSAKKKMQKSLAEKSANERTNFSGKTATNTLSCTMFVQMHISDLDKDKIKWLKAYLQLIFTFFRCSFLQFPKWPNVLFLVVSSKFYAMVGKLNLWHHYHDCKLYLLSNLLLAELQSSSFFFCVLQHMAAHRKSLSSAVQPRFRSSFSNILVNNQTKLLTWYLRTVFRIFCVLFHRGLKIFSWIFFPKVLLLRWHSFSFSMKMLPLGACFPALWVQVMWSNTWTAQFNKRLEQNFPLSVFTLVI